MQTSQSGSANRQQRSSAGGDGEGRRPIGYWAEFNNWWRTRLSERGCRPSQAELAQWFETNAPLCWRTDDVPSLKELRTHAKCLRSTEQVRNYFRKYRAARKATSASMRTSCSDSDSEDAALADSTAIQSRMLGASSGHPDPSSLPEPSRSNITSKSDALGLLPFVFSAGTGAGLFIAGANGAFAGLALQATTASGQPTASAQATEPNSPTGGCKPTTSTWSNQQSIQSALVRAASTTSGRPNAGTLGLPPRLPPTTTGVPPTKPSTTLPPAAAAVSGPVISFNAAGQPQHSAHGPGTKRSIGGGIVLQLPVLQRTGSVNNVSSQRSGGAAPTKHGSPAPSVPPSKRQATVRPACSAPSSSVCLDLAVGATPAYAANLSAGFASGPTTGCPGLPYMTPSYGSGYHTGGSSYMPHNPNARPGTAPYPSPYSMPYAPHAEHHVGCQTPLDPAVHAAQGLPPYFVRMPFQQLPPLGNAHQLDGQQPPVPAHADAMEGNSCIMAGAAMTTVPPGGAMSDEACNGAPLSPTQAFFRTWQMTDMEDLLLELPVDDMGLAPLTLDANAMAAAAAPAVAVAAPLLSVSLRAQGTAVGSKDDANNANLTALPITDNSRVEAISYGHPTLAVQASVVAAQGTTAVPAQSMNAGQVLSVTMAPPEVNGVRWWPDGASDVGACLPPIRTKSPSTTTGQEAGAEDVRHLLTPTAATVAKVMASDQGMTAAEGANGNGGGNGGGGASSGLSPASASELFKMLDAPPGVVRTKAASAPPPQGQPSTGGDVQQRVKQNEAPVASATTANTTNPILSAPPAPETDPRAAASAAAAAAAAASRGSYPPTYPPTAWPTTAYVYPPHPHPLHGSSPDPNVPPPPNGMSAAASAMPYQTSLPTSYPYSLHPAHYPPYGYGPPPYTVNPSHHQYYYHQMPPPPSNNGYDMYGWSPYGYPPHPAMPFPGNAPPYGPPGSGYHSYPLSVGPHMGLPMPASHSQPLGPTEGTGMPPDPTTSGPHRSYPTASGGPPEASSVRVRAAAAAARLAPSTTHRTSLPSLTHTHTHHHNLAAAEPLMPGRYVWQATSGAVKLRAAATVAAAPECSEAESVGMCGDTVSGMRTGGAISAVQPAGSQLGPQGSYCSHGHARYSQSVGGMPAVVQTVGPAVVVGGDAVEECVESGGSEGKDAGGNSVVAGGAAQLPPPAVQQQLMPPPPPRLPQSERMGSGTIAPQPTLSGGLELKSASGADADNVHPISETIPQLMYNNSGGNMHLTAGPLPLLPAANPQPCSSTLAATDNAAPNPISDVTHVTPQRQQRPASELTTDPSACGVLPLPLPAKQLPALVNIKLEQQSPTPKHSTSGLNSFAMPPTDPQQHPSLPLLSPTPQLDSAVKREDCNVGFDDGDLLDLSSITAGLFSPPASAVQGISSARSWGRGAAAGGFDATPSTAAASAAAAALTFAFTPVQSYANGRPHAFAAPPAKSGPAAANAGGQPLEMQHNAPATIPSTDIRRQLATPCTVGSPLDCSLLASWLISPASVDVCAPLGLGVLGDEVASGGAEGKDTPERGANMLSNTMDKFTAAAGGSADTDGGEAAGVYEHGSNAAGTFGKVPDTWFTNGGSSGGQSEGVGRLQNGSVVTVGPQSADVTAHIRITYVPPPKTQASVEDSSCARGFQACFKTESGVSEGDVGGWEQHCKHQLPLPLADVEGAAGLGGQSAKNSVGGGVVM